MNIKVTQLCNKSLYFKEPYDLLLYKQKPTTSPCPKPDANSHTNIESFKISCSIIILFTPKFPKQAALFTLPDQHFVYISHLSHALTIPSF